MFIGQNNSTKSGHSQWVFFKMLIRLRVDNASRINIELHNFGKQLSLFADYHYVLKYKVILRNNWLHYNA